MSVTTKVFSFDMNKSLKLNYFFTAEIKFFSLLHFTTKIIAKIYEFCF